VPSAVNPPGRRRHTLRERCVAGVAPEVIGLPPGDLVQQVDVEATVLCRRSEDGEPDLASEGQPEFRVVQRDRRDAADEPDRNDLHLAWAAGARALTSDPSPWLKVTTHGAAELAGVVAGVVEHCWRRVRFLAVDGGSSCADIGRPARLGAVPRTLLGFIDGCLGKRLVSNHRLWCQLARGPGPTVRLGQGAMAGGLGEGVAHGEQEASPCSTRYRGSALHRVGRPGRTRVRLARPGDLEQVSGLIPLAGIRLDRAVAAVIEAGAVASALLLGLDNGVDDLRRRLAGAVAAGRPEEAMPGLILVLVAEGRDGVVRGVLQPVPPPTS
jgi:hypothetical protein